MQTTPTSYGKLEKALDKCSEAIGLIQTSSFSYKDIKSLVDQFQLSLTMLSSFMEDLEVVASGRGRQKENGEEEEESASACTDKVTRLEPELPQVDVTSVTEEDNGVSAYGVDISEELGLVSVKTPTSLESLRAKMQQLKK